MPMRPCWVEIRTQSFEENYKFLQSLTPSAELLAIVKADAYGHSLALCAPAATRAGAHWLGVTSVEEGVAARRVCPQARILVIGGVFPGQGGAVVEHCLTPAVWDLGQFDEIEAAASAAGVAAGALPIHLEIDTGMSRQGISLEDIDAFVRRIGLDSPFRVEGIMTHLYASDDTDNAATEAQLNRLDQAMRQVTSVLSATAVRPQWLSVGATAALLRGEADAISVLAGRWGMRAMLRPGLALYGLAPRFEPPFEPSREPATLTRAHAQLQPVMSWKTRVTSVRSILAGTDVGYNGTFVATEPMRLALLAVGYADGLDRKLGNRFSLLVRGQRAPIVGRISMDQAVIDVTEIPSVEAGDEVVILGSQGGEVITAFDHGEAAGTIPWEVFTRIAARVQRVEV